MEKACGERSSATAYSIGCVFVSIGRMNVVIAMLICKNTTTPPLFVRHSKFEQTKLSHGNTEVLNEVQPLLVTVATRTHQCAISLKKKIFSLKHNFFFFTSLLTL